MTTFEVTRDVIQFSVGTPVTFDVVPTTVSFTVQPGPGADGSSFTARGPWDSGDTYAVGDVVSFDGGNYILYASPPTGGDPDVDTAHWDVFGSSSVPDGTTSVKGIVQLEDSHTSTSTTKAATPKNVKEAYDLAAAAQPADSDLTAIAGATLTGDGYLKRASSVWSLDTPSGGGGSLPSPTGEVGAVLGVDESETYALQRYIQYGDGDAYAIAAVQTDRVRLEAADGLGGIAGVNVYMDGSVGIETTGPVTVTAADGTLFAADDAETKIEPGITTVGVSSDLDYIAPRPQETVRARGTDGTPAAVEDGDVLAYALDALAFDGTDYVAAAAVTVVVDGTVAAGKVPALLRFSTADADGVLTDRLVLNPDGTSELNGTLLDLDTSGASTGDVATWDGTKIVLDTPTGGGGGGGGLVLVDSGTFSGSSGFSVDNCFSSTYDDYRIFLVLTGTTDVLVAMRMRLSGTDSSSSYYSQRVFGYSTTPGAATNTTGTDDMNVAIGSNGAKISSTIELHDPGTAVHTIFEAVGNSAFSSTGRLSHVFTGGHDVATAYDGFSIIPSAGTITGRYVVYGYAK